MLRPASCAFPVGNRCGRDGRAPAALENPSGTALVRGEGATDSPSGPAALVARPAAGSTALAHPPRTPVFPDLAHRRRATAAPAPLSGPSGGSQRHPIRHPTDHVSHPTDRTSRPMNNVSHPMDRTRHPMDTIRHPMAFFEQNGLRPTRFRPKCLESGQKETTAPKRSLPRSCQPSGLP